MNTFFDRLFSTLYVLFIAAVFYGYCANLYYFVKADFEAPYKEEFIRAVAIPFMPIAVIVGYIDLDDKKEGMQ